MIAAMIDLETMGRSARAPIVSIGAVKFDMDLSCPLPVPTLEDDHQFYRVVSLRSSVEAGLEMDPETVMWWLDQTKDAQNSLLPAGTGAIVDLPRALYLLKLWWETPPKPVTMWSHATFDAVILHEAYRLCAMDPPWHYREVRDLRTAQAEVDCTQYAYDYRNHHHALYDAWRQANLLKWVRKQVRERG